MHLILMKPAHRKQPDLRIRSRERRNAKRFTENRAHLFAGHATGDMTHVDRGGQLGGNASVGGEVLLPPVSGTREMRTGCAAVRRQREHHQKARGRSLPHTLDHILFFYINN
jgi:hypothetical protein